VGEGLKPMWKMRLSRRRTEGDSRVKERLRWPCWKKQEAGSRRGGTNKNRRAAILVEEKGGSHRNVC